jgi:hypothetical protein
MGVISPQQVSQPCHAAFAVYQNFVVPEADHAVALSLDRSSSLDIPLMSVLSAVNLDNDLGAMTGEVDDVVAEGHLLTKPGRRKIYLEQAPHRSLRLGRVPAQLAGSDDGNGGRVFLHWRYT